MNEQQLAKRVAEWMAADGWKVYEEVDHLNGRVDLVGRRHHKIHAVECKTSMCLDLIGQARGVLDSFSAHFVSVAVPAPKNHRRSHAYADRILTELGVGVIEVGGLQGSVYMRARPKFKRPFFLGKDKNALGLCRGNRYKGIAGTNGGGYWTPYKETCDRARVFVLANPGCTARELLADIDHHYASDSAARVTFPRRVIEGNVRGIEARKVGRLWTFFPTP